MKIILINAAGENLFGISIYGYPISIYEEHDAEIEQIIDSFIIV